MHDRLHWEPEGYHQLGVGMLIDVRAEDVLSRLKEASQTQSAEELAEWLETTLTSIMECKDCNIIPIRWLHKLVLNRSAYNPFWVLVGEGSRLSE